MPPIVAIAEVAPCLHVPHIAPYCHPRGPFCIQSLLQQPFHFTAHMPIQLFFKECFPLFPLQLKMTSVEDFQFSHQGVPPSWSLRSGESTPFFFSLSIVNVQKRSYATGLWRRR